MNEVTLVTLQATDSKNPDGSWYTQKFDIEHAQRIMDVRHPNKGWKLADPSFEMKAGQITAISTAKEVKK